MAENTELRDILKALKEADKAGNIEDARRLAEIADRLTKSQPAETTVETPKEKALPFLTKGLARSLGAPVDIVNLPLRAIGLGAEEPFLGSKSIERGLRKIGLDVPEREPKRALEHIVSGVGEATGMFLPGLTLTKALAPAKGVIGAVAKPIYETVTKYPKTTILSEITGGAGMGLGREISEEYPKLGPIPELMGGFAGAAVPTALTYTPTRLAIKIAKDIGRKAHLPFTEAGARYRAGEFIKKQVAEPTVVAEKLAAQPISDLPPVALTGEERLMALYNQIRSLDPVKDAQAIDKITKAARKLENEMRALARGSPEVLKTITERRIAKIESDIDRRITQRMEVAQRKIDSLPISQRQSQESIIVRDELRRAMEQEKAFERQAWKAVPKSTIVRVDNTKKAFADTLETLATAQRSDIPAVLRASKILKEETVETTINELQGLRSKLLEVSRQARANSQWNKARIAEDVADSILEDMTLSAERILTPEGEVLRNALAATKHFKQRFEQGTVGKILGYERTSAPSIPPELTLDIATRGRGIVDIRKVVVTPEAERAAERYIARSFTDYSLDSSGAINPIKAEKFLRNNDELLDAFPTLRSKLSDISEAQKLATVTKNAMELRKARLRDPNVSIAARFLNTNVGDGVRNILRSPAPAYAANQLIRQARKDVTGQALDGLRSGFVEHILDRSSIGAYNELGERTLSGRTMLGFMNENSDVLAQVFSKEQINRMKTIGQELAKIEMLESTRGRPIEFSDVVSNILKFASRFGGAAVGRHWGRVVGAGGTVQIPGFFAQQWHKYMSFLTKNRFEALVNDAIISPDKSLLQSLLMPIDKPFVAGGRQKEVIKRLNAWLMAEGNRVLQDTEPGDVALFDKKESQVQPVSPPDLSKYER